MFVYLLITINCETDASPIKHLFFSEIHLVVHFFIPQFRIYQHECLIVISIMLYASFPAIYIEIQHMIHQKKIHYFGKQIKKPLFIKADLEYFTN